MSAPDDAPEWSLMQRDIIYVGRKIQVVVDTETGRDGLTICRDIVLHPGAVAILPIVDREQICMVRNVRPTVGETLIEIPAGTLEPGELPEHAAARELAEETGYRAGRWTRLAEIIPSPGILSEKIHLFVAEELTPGEMNLEHDEDLKPERVPLGQALEWALDGTIRDAKTLVALFLWKDRHRNSSNP
jgi:ADP-ribose pyrophosphatase